MAVKCMPDHVHVHIFIGYNLDQKIPDLVKVIKTTSAKWINDNHFCSNSFNWQRGYGAFTHVRSIINNVYQYIMNQEVDHKKTSFKDEFLSFLNKNDSKYDEK